MSSIEICRCMYLDRAQLFCVLHILYVHIFHYVQRFKIIEVFYGKICCSWNAVCTQPDNWQHLDEWLSKRRCSLQKFQFDVEQNVKSSSTLFSDMEVGQTVEVSDITCSKFMISFLWMKIKVIDLDDLLSKD